MLADAGLERASLAVNCYVLDPGIGAEALTYLGAEGQGHCTNFTPLGLGAQRVLPPRTFTVRLHFAEPDDDAQPGQRVFDVKLQGATVLTAFDMRKAAGAVRTAVVKEFKGVRAGPELSLEIVPKDAALTPANAPILCAFELVEDGFKPQ